MPVSPHESQEDHESTHVIYENNSHLRRAGSHFVSDKKLDLSIRKVRSLVTLDFAISRQPSAMAWCPAR